MQRADDTRQLTNKQVSYAYDFFSKRIEHYLSSPENLLEAFKALAGEKDISRGEFDSSCNADELMTALRELDKKSSVVPDVFRGERYNTVATSLFTEKEMLANRITPSIRYILAAVYLAAGADLYLEFTSHFEGLSIPLMVDFQPPTAFMKNEERHIREALMKAKIMDYAKAVANNTAYQSTQNRHDSLVNKAVDDYILVQYIDSFQLQNLQALPAAFKRLDAVIHDGSKRLPIEQLTQHAALSLLSFVVENKGNSDDAYKAKLDEVVQLAQQLLICRGNPGLGEIRKKALAIGKDIEKDKRFVTLLDMLARLIYQIDKRMMFGGKEIDFKSTVAALQGYINKKIDESGSKNANASDLRDMLRLIGDARISPATQLTEMCAAMQEVLTRKSTQGFFGESKLEACLIGILNEIREGKHLIFQHQEKPSVKPGK